MSDPFPHSLPMLLKEALGDAYTIEGEIGRGGMGVVYRARDERLQRRVAIKVLPPELAFSSEIRQRFTREAQTAARLSHPHIVPIHDVGEGQGIVYFVMGLIEGESLAARIRRRGRVPAEETRRIIRETADALSAAHAMSVIHRDIKPDNILLEGTRGRVVVTDFGIAKALSATSGSTLTSAGMAIGTPSYMSPEQAAGEREIDGRSDLYSVGIVAYQMLSGVLPFNAPTVAGILMKQITETAPLLHENYPDVPEDLSLAVARCLEKDPANRWPSADALRRSLESRSVAGYRPTGLGWKAQTREATGTARPSPTRPSPTRGLRPPAERPAPVRPVSPTRPGTTRPTRPDDGFRVGIQVGGRDGGLASRMDARAADRQARRDQKALRREMKDGPLPDTGEPLVVVRARRDFARWFAINGGLFLINMTFAGGPQHPWFLVPAAAMGMSLIGSYSKLWQAGYSWRDVLHRPDAPDAVGSGDKRPKIKGIKQIAEPKAAEFGAYQARMQQVYKDRGVILSLMSQLSQADKDMLPEIVETTEGLYARAAQLAGTLGSMESLGIEDTPRIEARLAELKQRPEGEERDRQIALLGQQLQRYQELNAQRTQFADRFESCVLAMQNVRLDLMRLRQSGVGAVLSGLTMATQQARALSRDVDIAIGAAAEVKAL
jgi:serine/threonine protein kinase